MNKKIKPEKYRKLSKAAFVIGMLATGLICFYLVFFLIISFMGVVESFLTIIYFIYAAILGLSITAVVCGSIDIKRIKAGRYSNKGRGFDSGGIVMGVIFILFVLGSMILNGIIFQKGGPLVVDGSSPSWSPDGKMIAFQSDRDGNYEIYVINADGSGQINLTNNTAKDFTPSWSPDGKMIAFQSNRDDNAEIYVMNADGSGQTNLTNNPAGDFDPSWSPDRKMITFFSKRDTTFSDHGDIYVMNADGSGQTNLTNNPAIGGDPSWSPDGKMIAFFSNRDTIFSNHGDIYVMNADGSGQTNLTNNTAADNGDPSWSPDGKMIAFESGRPRSDIYVMNADGSGQTNLTNNRALCGDPSWSPDGKMIAFVVYHAYTTPAYEIYIINIDVQE